MISTLQGHEKGLSCGTFTWQGLVVLLVSLFFPLMSIALVPNMIRNYVIATNVEMMKDREIITHVMQVLLCCCGAEMIAGSLLKSGSLVSLRDDGFQHGDSTMVVCFVIVAEEC